MTLAEAGFAGELEVLIHRDITDGLAQALQPREMVVMGAPSDAPVATLFGETVPAALARTGRHPVVVVRDVEPRQARRFERIFFRRG